MKEFLLIGQALVSLVLIALILLQQRGGGLGSIFGGEFYGKARGIEKTVLLATVLFGLLFVVLAILNLLY